MAAESPLQRALALGLETGGDLGAELAKLDVKSIASVGDAQALCEAVDRV